MMVLEGWNSMAREELKHVKYEIKDSSWVDVRIYLTWLICAQTMIRATTFQGDSAHMSVFQSRQFVVAQLQV